MYDPSCLWVVGFETPGGSGWRERERESETICYVHGGAVDPDQKKELLEKCLLLLSIASGYIHLQYIQYLKTGDRIICPLVVISHTK